MKNTIPYYDSVESRLNTICTEHKSILNYSISSDEVKLYLIEGDYYGDDYSSCDEDKRIVLVKGDDYEDYFVSDYLIEMTNTYRDSLEYAGHFKSLDDFCEKFGV